jgi:microcystin-dependent protein
MSQPFMGEVKIIAWNFAPQGWAFCNGQFLPINQNQALFSILGTMYGGNGQTTFALPDLRGRTSIHIGQGFTQGQAGGELVHTLNTAEMPAHNHFVQATSDAGNSAIPAGKLLAKSAPDAFKLYAPAGGALVTLRAGTIANAGSSQPHTNVQPYLVVNFIIALQGIFPSRN